MLILSSMIGLYALFYDSIAANETLNKAALCILIVYASMSLVWHFRAVLFD